MLRLPTTFLFLAALLAAALGTAWAQEDEDAERSRFVRFIEETISAPNTQVRLIGLEGSLSRDVSLRRITVSDDEGVWLTIEEPRFRWNRAALLAGDLVINELSAQSLTFTRPPIEDESLPSPEARAFTIPELPVSISIDALSLPRAEFGEPVFGLASALSLDGSLQLDNDMLDADLDIVRLDSTGGRLDLDVALANETLDIDVRLEEPADGVLANLLNIEGRPPIELALSGGGPLGELDIDLAFDVSGARTLDGSLTTARQLLGGGTRARFDLQGPLADILPEQERPFFGERSELRGALVYGGGNGLLVETVTLESGALGIEASGRLLPDGFPAQLQLRAALDPTEGARLALPSAPRTTLEGAQLTLDYTGSDWRLAARLDQLRSPELTMVRATIDANGTVTDLQIPEQRAMSFELMATAEGYAPADADLAAMIGPDPDLQMRGEWRASEPLRIAGMGARIAAVTLDGDGIIEGFGFSGRLRAQADDLALLPDMGGRDLAGRASAQLTGKVQPIGGAFDLDVDASIAGLEAGTDLLGRLVAGDVTLSGGVERSVDGLAFETFEGRSASADFAVNGLFASDRADLNAAFSLADLSVLDDTSSGMAGAQLAISRDPPADDETASERTDPFSITATLLVPEGRLAGQPVQGLRADLVGEALDALLSGTVSGAGSVAGEALSLAAVVERNGDDVSVEGLSLSIGAAELSGGLALSSGLATGNLSLDAQDIAGFAALALTDASGGVRGTVDLTANDGRQDATIDLTANDLRYGTTVIGSAEIDGNLTDLFGDVGGSLEASARNVSAGGLAIETLQGSASSGANEPISFGIDAVLAGRVAIGTAGTADIADDSARVRFDRLQADTPYGDARLAAPSTIVITEGVARTDALTVLIEGGRIALSGSAGADTLDLSARVTALPLSIANAVRAGLGAAGTLNGTIDASGTPQSPRIAFDLDANGVTAAPLGQAGVEPFSVSANGALDQNRLALSGLTAANAQGLDLTAAGTVPLAGQGLNISVSGAAPLALAEAALAARGTQLQGTARFEGRAVGALTSPSLSGLVSVTGGQVLDPLANVELSNVNVLAGLEGDRIVLRNASAQLGGGGLSLTGQIGLAAPFPADLSLQLAGVRYTDGRMVTADLGADLSITGPLAGGALIGGVVDLARVEIAVPDAFGSGDELLAVSHVDPDTGTLATLRRIEAIMGDSDGGAPAAPFRLDLDVRAPNQIFVRGRGLDVELGGRLGLAGSLASIVPTGGFDLIRGRLEVLGQRFEFTNGRLTLAGDLDPLVDLTAEVTTGDLLVTIRLIGPASDLALELSSSPELPEDEIFARLLFGTDIASLSPIQIARLAEAAASLAGGGSGLTGGLRSALGVDDLDIVEGDEGGVGVRVGRYLTDNVYLELEAVDGETETSINLDITDSLTARGSAGSDGETSLGIFFERDY